MFGDESDDFFGRGWFDDFFYWSPYFDGGVKNIVILIVFQILVWRKMST